MSPVDYSLCDRTVTLYRLENGGIRREVLENCYYTWRQEEETDYLGTRRETKFLLILPGSREIRIGDRIYDGVGPELTADQWPSFLPVQLPGLAEVAYVRPVWWEGQLCHVEAGRQ